MKKHVAIIALLAIAVGLMLAPTAGSAANCRNDTPRPVPPSDAQTLPDGGKAWVNHPTAGSGANGMHGYIVVKQTATGATIYGRNSETGLNGEVTVDQNGPQRICIDHTGS